MNSIGAIIVGCFAVFWVAAGASQLGRWFLPLLAMSILPQVAWAPVVGIGCAVILWSSLLRAFF